MLGRCMAATVGMITALAAATGGTALASSSGSSSQVVDSEEHCIVVLDKLKPGQSVSRVAGRYCADSPEAAARLRAANDPSPQATTLLLVVYEDANFGGASTRLEGSAGPCDTAGYGISALVPAWRNRITSFKRFNVCQIVTGYDNTNYGGATYGPWRADTANVGSAANDHIDSLRLRRA
ncbi:hypothetical protein GCM10027569_86500 [Flindersiella endophytica]